MRTEDKELLLKDLCARLPYGVMCQMEDEIRFIGEKSPYYDYILSERHIELFRRHKGFYIKPYLRPMSSMTEEEKNELKQISNDYLDEWEHTKTSLERWKLDAKGSYKRAVFYNSHHFDWNDLIPKGLAIEVTENNNPYEN